MAWPPHRAAAISMRLILLISGTFPFADPVNVQDFIAELGWVKLQTRLLRIPVWRVPCSATHGPSAVFVCGTDVHRVPAEEWYTETIVLIWHDSET